ncbi:hypothetical protein F5Y06DRAFT_291079 [Hypoxylon sp. FL0890]|nr:hypothetical protein F5Y06DRAFT_291079 [Hypoxylon sp. FL0890]
MTAREILRGFGSSLKLGEAVQEEEDELRRSFPLEIESTQKAADLYRSGQKLWIASDLERIEYELAHYKDMTSFTIRRIDGSMVSIKNPMYGVTNPIWWPWIVFQDYWYLTMKGYKETQLRDELPHSFPYYPYFITWANQAYEQFVDDDPPLDTEFEEVKQEWERSPECDWLKRKLATVIGGRKITKVMCFALGSLDHSRVHEKKKQLIQHMFALTVATAARAATGGDVELFAQEPWYTQPAKDVLKKAGFSIIGEHGAGGLAKIDDHSIVFSCCPAFPIRQIIADLARPAIIIGTWHESIFTDKKYVAPILVSYTCRDYPHPFDTVSPRTREMFKEYTSHDIEVVDPEERDLRELKDMKIHVRNDVTRGACMNEGIKESAE